jgi:hypothetical protein
MVIVTSFREGPLLGASEFGLLDCNIKAGFLGEVRGVSLPNI